MEAEGCRAEKEGEDHFQGSSPCRSPAPGSFSLLWAPGQPLAPACLGWGTIPAATGPSVRAHRLYGGSPADRRLGCRVL